MSFFWFSDDLCLRTKNETLQESASHPPIAGAIVDKVILLVDGDSRAGHMAMTLSYFFQWFFDHNSGSPSSIAMMLQNGRDNSYI